MPKAIFAGIRAKWQGLYEELQSMATERLGTFTEKETSQAILWKHHTSFAEIRAKNDALVIGFASDVLHEEWQPVKTVQTSKNRVAHYFEVKDNTEFPIFIERIAQAYALTQSGHAPRKAKKAQVYSTVEEYIALYPADIRSILEKLRSTIREAAPQATEKLSWRMPTYWQGENLIHFAVAKNHIGLYPGESGVAAFADKLKEFKATKGAIQFPLSRPIPYELIAEITRFRVKEAQARKK